SCTMSSPSEIDPVMRAQYRCRSGLISATSSRKRPRASWSVETRESSSVIPCSLVERHDAAVAFQAERDADLVLRVGEDRHDVLADFSRRHRRAEAGEERLDGDALALRVGLGAHAPDLGFADDL